MKRFPVLAVVYVLLLSSCTDSERIKELEEEIVDSKVHMLVSQKALSDSFDRTSEISNENEELRFELEQTLEQVADLENQLTLRRTYRDPSSLDSLAFESSNLSLSADHKSLELVAFDPFNFKESGKEFIEGESIEFLELEDGSEVPGNCDYIRNFLVAEVVPESQGPEVLVGFTYTPCIASFGNDVRIFAGDTPDAVPLGDSLSGILLRVDDDRGVLTGVPGFSIDRDWGRCCPDQLLVSKYHWVNGDWEQEWTEIWRLEKKLEGEDLIELIEERVVGLVERTGIRGRTVLAPHNWLYTYKDGGGSGSWSYWRNGYNTLEEVGLKTGASFGTWLGLDGIEGSVDPTLNLIHDWGDDVVIEKAGDRIFNFTVRKKIDKAFKDSQIAVNGVWVAHLGENGSCCVAFTEAWITLEERSVYGHDTSGFHNEVVREFRDYVISNID